MLALPQSNANYEQSWVTYAHRTWIDKAIELGPLRVLTPLALHNLNIPDMFEVTTEFFTDILTNFPAFFTASDFESLAVHLSCGPAQLYVATLRAGDFDAEPMAFSRFIFAYGDAVVQDLAKNVEDPNSRQIMRHLIDLLGCEGCAGAEDQVCSQGLEFWTTFTEFLIDSLFAAGDTTHSWMENARQYIPEVIEACWKKILIPTQDTTDAWNSEDRASFTAFRSDVEDLLQSSFTLLGIDIFERFVSLALESLSNHAWSQLEATIFCLNALSDSISDESSSDAILSRLFSSSLFSDMMNSSSMPAKTRQTTVNLILNYTSFFERNAEYLPSMLNFLFESLKWPVVASVASRAISSTCWACRKALVPELGAFLRQYEIIHNWNNVEATTKSKVMGAIAAIIQALPLDEERIDPLYILLHFVEIDVGICMDLMTAGQHEQAQAYGLCALGCLINMGKAFQLPDDVAIDLDAETPHTALWKTGRGAAVQAKIIGLMNTMTNSMRTDSTIMEAGCRILHTGYKEHAPGPFVFPPSVTETFVISSGLQTARLDYVLETAGAMLSRHSSSPAIEFNRAALTFLIHLLGIIRIMDSKYISIL